MISVHRVEYAYGSHEQATTGIFEGEPKQCEGFTFRKQILIGWTELNPNEVKRVMDELAREYKGTSYNLITRNCNHFCNDLCLRLTGNSIPRWINRLARIGNFLFKTNFFYFLGLNPGPLGVKRDFVSTTNRLFSWLLGFLCNCIVPASINSTKVGIEDKLDDKMCNEAEIKAKLKSRSSRFTSSSSSPASFESSPGGRTGGRGRTLLSPSNCSSIMVLNSSSWYCSCVMVITSKLVINLCFFWFCLFLTN